MVTELIDAANISSNAFSFSKVSAEYSIKNYEIPNNGLPENIGLFVRNVSYTMLSSSVTST